MHCAVLLSSGTLWSSCSRYCHCGTEPSRRPTAVCRTIFLFVTLTTLIYNILNDRPGNMGCLCIWIVSLFSSYFGYFQHSVFIIVPATRLKWGDICCLIVIDVTCSHVLHLRFVFLMASVDTWYIMRIMCFSFCWLQRTVFYECVNMAAFWVLWPETLTD